MPVLGVPFGSAWRRATIVAFCGPMIVPAALATLAKDETFWSHWWFEGDAASGSFALEACDVCIPLGARHTLMLRISEPRGYYSLWLLSAGAYDVQLGWDDQASWYPDVLRWEEVETIARCASVVDGTPHPGLVSLLLARFAPICTEEASLALPLLEDAAKAVGVASPAAYAGRREGFHWREIDGAWVVEQNSAEEERSKRLLYTLRSAPPNVDSAFPFTRWAEAMRDARDAACAIPAFERRSVPESPERHPVRLEVPAKSGRPAFVSQLRDALLSSRAGEILSVSLSSPEHLGALANASATLELVLVGDRARGEAIVRGALDALQIPYRLS